MTTDLLNPLNFSRLVARALEGEPDVVVVGINPLTLIIRIGAREVQLELDTYYEQYRSDPALLPLIGQALVETLRELPPARTVRDPALILDRLMPMLKPLALLNAVREQNVPMLAYRPFVGPLMTVYVVDEGSSAVYVNEQHLLAWKLDEPTLYRHALHNLRQRPAQFEIRGSGSRGLLTCTAQDGYAASRLLLPELFKQFERQLGGNLVIGVPNRDFLIAFSDADPEVVARLAAQIAQDHFSKPNPLTDQLLTIRGGSVHIYQE